MTEKTPNHVHGSSTSQSMTDKSPDSDVSPSAPMRADYFSVKSASPTPADRPCKVTFAAGGRDGDRGSSTSPGVSPGNSASSLGEGTATVGSSSRRASSNGSERPHTMSRKSSAASVSFRPPRNPSLPQGLPRKTDSRRLRESSPSPVTFKQHVGFDNLPNGEATKHNTSSLSLQVRHQGYRPSRMSRTFMVGVDDHAYSDYALVWLLHNMVDDGDEVVCVRVLESPVRTSEKSYQEDAWRLMRSIQAKNELNKAISLILEYSVGKLHATFQQLIQIYQPSMLIVGTRGRSLGGIQGLMNTRNSFSKYCLQYSPVPVVVVRPDDKRNKKKEKRMLDPTRQSYVAMLAHNAGRHEADSGASSAYELERGLSADEEAHRVAAAIGLPAAFDPTIKPFDHRGSSARRHSPSVPPSPPLAEMTSASSPQIVPSTESGDEESEEEEYEVEAVSASQLLPGNRQQTDLEREQKKRLHAMEVGEAAALLKSGKKETDDEDDDDESQERSQNGVKS